MRVTILGCGTSNGVPRIGDDWGDCDPKNPRNRRRRASIVVESDSTSLLVDTTPDLRDQALDFRFSDFDAVLYTHDHADHSHGIDDLRQIVRRRGRAMDIYANQETLDSLVSRFDYAFATDKPHHPSFLTPHTLMESAQIGDIDVQTFEQVHGNSTTLGLRFGGVAYTTDCMKLPEAAFPALENLDLWIVAVLGRHPHPTHAHLELALSWIERVEPRLAILTHMSAGLDYDTLLAELPPGVVPAYDGMVIDVND